MKCHDCGFEDCQCSHLNSVIYFALSIFLGVAYVLLESGYFERFF